MQCRIISWKAGNVYLVFNISLNLMIFFLKAAYHASLCSMEPLLHLARAVTCLYCCYYAAICYMDGSCNNVDCTYGNKNVVNDDSDDRITNIVLLN